MKFRRFLVFALTVALAFAGSAGPRHAQAAVQKHHHVEEGQQSGHSHNHAADHAHYDDGSAVSKFTAGGTHDHAGTQPVSDQGCCYAWCNSVAIIQATDGFQLAASHGEHFRSEQPFRIAVFSSAIDPPPR